MRTCRVGFYSNYFPAMPKNQASALFFSFSPSFEFSRNKFYCLSFHVYSAIGYFVLTIDTIPQKNKKKIKMMSCSMFNRMSYVTLTLLMSYFMSYDLLSMSFFLKIVHHAYLNQLMYFIIIDFTLFFNMLTIL